MLNRKVATSAKVQAFADEFGPWAMVFHHRLVAFLDKNGNCRADHYWLKGQVMPFIHAVTPDTCSAFVTGLEQHGLAVTYTIDAMPYLHMPGFKDEQVGLNPKKEKPEVPVPVGFDEDAREWPISIRKSSGKNPEIFRKASGQ